MQSKRSRNCPTPDLLIVGEGPERTALERLAAKEGVRKRVRFLGRIDQQQLPKIYNAMDALVLPSSREGWANVLLEVHGLRYAGGSLRRVGDARSCIRTRSRRADEDVRCARRIGRGKASVRSLSKSRCDPPLRRRVQLGCYDARPTRPVPGDPRSPSAEQFGVRRCHGPFVEASFSELSIRRSDARAQRWIGSEAKKRFDIHIAIRQRD